jgi:hypothetical protein
LSGMRRVPEFLRDPLPLVVWNHEKSPEVGEPRGFRFR